MDTSVIGDLAGQVLGGRYRVEESIASSGMANVYLATDQKLGRTVAIKLLHANYAADPEFLARFEREARATAALSHPNIVLVHDFDQVDGVAFLVLGYVPGHNLRKVLQHHRLSPSQALELFEPILAGLSAAHLAGVIHRDIKPENILLGPNEVKVADFGLARALDDPNHKTRTGMMMGTPAYVSPEHVLGEEISAASDIYSAGILLFEMLTGEQPFAAENSLAVAYKHVNSEVPRPSTLVPDLPTELDDLVIGATARTPEDRFGSAAEYLAAVRRVRALLPPAEPLPPIPEELVLPDADAATTVQDPDATAKLAVASTDTAVYADSPAEPDVTPGRRWRMGVVLFTVATLLVAGLGWAFAAGPLQRATVPNIVGISESDANVLLENTGLRLTVTDREYSETVPVGVVISQDPAAESGTFIQFPVRAVVSLGPERYGVPDVRGLSVEDASQALVDTKLAVAGQANAFDEEVAAGLVAGTDPPVGTSLKPGTAVTLIISDGPAPVPVPEVLGAAEADARAALESLGLVVERGEDFSEQFGAGTVMALNPPVGQVVAKGSTVTMTVSKGPPPVVVPNVVDLRREDAVRELEAKGFRVQVNAGIITPLNRVYSQDPPPGETRPKGSTVTISIF